MKWVNSDNKRPIKSWCEHVDEDTLQQAANLANHPVVAKHVALMSDSHLGYGMPIGGVIACDHAIIPGAVGADIGCGVCAVKTSFDFTAEEEISEEWLKKIMGDIRRAVPNIWGEQCFGNPKFSRPRHRQSPGMPYQ